MDSIYLTPAYKLALAVFGFLGFYNTWGRTIINGTLVRLLTAIHGGPYELPGTDAMVMRTSFTGIYWPIDWICNVMIVFFWEVVDGSHPTTTAIGLYFIGQHLSIVTTIATFWLTLFQLTAIGCSGPWYLVCHLLISPTHLIHSRSLASQIPSLLGPPLEIGLLPFSIALGYIFPTWLMSLKSPAYVSADFKQVAISIWGGAFPLIILPIQMLLTAITKPFLPASLTTSPQSAQDSRFLLHAVRFTYLSALLMTLFAHFSTIFLSLSTIVFPMLFAPEFASAFHPSALLFPTFSWQAPASMGTATAAFMQWDQIFGYAAVLWLAGQNWFEMREVAFGMGAGGVLGFLRFVACVLGLCVAVGPGGAFLCITWARDEVLLGTGQGGEKGSSRVEKL